MSRVRRITTSLAVAGLVAAPLAVVGVVQGAAPQPGNAALGKVVFTKNCGSCHVLKAAGTKGQIGPNLNKVKPAYALVITRVTNGRGVMPAFKKTLTKAQIQNVAKYVATASKLK